jgi:hypothetical protein
VIVGDALATTNKVAAVLMPGAGLCQPEEVKRLLPRVKVREIEAATS